jgi:transcriptional regulator with XRE-family HTH domain
MGSLTTTHRRNGPLTQRGLASVCIYAYSVDVDQLVTNARASAGLAVRQLAAHADVAGSTITRIQAGQVDPSIETLRRILAAAGFDLVVGAVRSGMPSRPQIGQLADAWAIPEGRLRLDWTRWRAFLDALALHPELVPEAIYSPPPPAGESVVDALLAAVAEKLADDASLLRPAWTKHAPALRQPFVPPIARASAPRSVPYQLAERGLMIDTQSLWRTGESVGV